jgi:hypothetical protein
MDYKQKYLKYKKKYIGLKEQSIFEQSGGVRDKFLPCEITNDFKKIYYYLGLSGELNKDNIFKRLNMSDEDDIPIEKTSRGLAKFKQDPAIFLKSNIDETDHAIIINEGLDFSGFVRIEGYISINGNDKGGNFISSPCSPKNPYGIVFCFDKVSRHLLDYFIENLLQPIVPLSCSFRIGEDNILGKHVDGDRHIDECMCFMPYKDHYKVWIYKIRNISCSEDILQKLIKQLTEKGNNHIVEQIQDIESIRRMLDIERNTNIRIISNNLFGRENAVENFIEFPIDLEIQQNSKEYLDFKIKNIPIFNRLWYEKDDQCRAIFSIGEQIDPEVKTILDRELPFIGSIIDPTRIFKCDFINTFIHNNDGSEDGNAGGNLHCLVKMKY